MSDLSGRIVVVTGAGRGIGRAIAVVLAQRGAELVLASRTEKELEETAALCRSHRARAHVVVADIGEPRDVARLAGEALAIRGSVDALVNSAGIYGPIGPSHEVDPDAWEHAHRVNLFGPFRLARLLVPSMIAQRHGKLVFLAGGGATAPLPLLSSYASSKAAVVRLAETLAVELAPSNIQVNAISPGLVDTKLQDEVLEAGERAGPLFAKIRAAREKGTGTVPPEVAAGLVAFLVSDASRTLTGKLIAAPYDAWKDWGEKAEALNRSPMFTLRRLDPFTIRPLAKELE